MSSNPIQSNKTSFGVNPTAPRMCPPEYGGYNTRLCAAVRPSDRVGFLEKNHPLITAIALLRSAKAVGGINTPKLPSTPKM